MKVNKILLNFNINYIAQDSLRENIIDFQRTIKNPKKERNTNSTVNNSFSYNLSQNSFNSSFNKSESRFNQSNYKREHKPLPYTLYKHH